ncbi:prephenate dehydrogenase [Stackebrandtia albiflava]|uniref:Prephenate dehydrogenase n=1 Tax=Stackebrandtia albiflava TaxID=406432 RepID=A0A562VE85_9ACTN|nr:prephenate dehydrogenase/arogenate dehydrogenase family protein [Stackebrandtia albiflava]TWJ16131.1 prephenate dehydrogenase [Stackebrandtia albiflava]
MWNETVGSLRFAVIGTGLIGGSILRRLSDAGADVIGWDPDPETVRYGHARTIPFTDRLSDAVIGRDVVLLAAPLSAIPAALDSVAPHLGSDCLVTDVGSAKAGVAAHGRTTGVADRFIPGHPMAGTERAGLAAADPELFDEATWVLCPDPAVPLRLIRRLIHVVVTLFGAQATLMAAEDHDRTVALSSHIPHLLAATLAGAVARSDSPDAVLGLAAGSFRDGTRVTGTPPRRTVDMLAHNRAAVLAGTPGVEEFLADLLAAVRQDDVKALTELVDEAHRLRDRLTGRPMRQRVHRFGAAESDEERAFLMSTGTTGGQIVDVVSDPEGTGYTFRSPAG